MTLTPPTINPLDLTGYPSNYRPYPDVAPFTQRSAMTYQQKLESLAAWIPQVLVPYLSDTFQTLDDRLVDDVNNLAAAVNEALASQATAVNGAISDAEGQISTLAAEAVQARLAEVLAAETPNNDPAILAVLQATSSATRDFLDARYDARYLPTAKKNAITGGYHVDGYGASSTAPAATNRAAIQQAVTDAHAEYLASGARQKIIVPGKVYPVDLVPWLDAGGVQHGVVAVIAQDGVDWDIHGVIKLNASAFTATTLATGYGAIVRSPPAGLSHVAFRGVAQGGFDGNSSANPSGTTVGGNLTGVSNMDISAIDDVTVSDTTQTNSTLQGVRITANQSVTACTHIRVNRNKVSNIAAIGLQVSNFDGLHMLDNMVDSTGDNALDIYGENGSAVATGTNFIVGRNIVRNGATGIFLETVAYGTCADNVVVSCPTGIHLNRINGEPRNVDVHDNTVYGGATPFLLTGSMRSVSVHHNTARAFTGQGMQFGSGASTTANIAADNNMLDGVDATIPLYRFAGASVTGVTISNPRSFTVTDPAVYYVTDAGTTVSVTSVVLDPVSPAAKSISESGSVASGGTLNFTAAKGTSGTLIIEANSGGSWYSVWSGIINGGNGRVDVAQLATSGATPGNAIVSVAGSTTTNVVLVTFRATGSTVSYKYRYDPAS